MNKNVKPGDYVQIIEMVGEPDYSSLSGIVRYIDDAGQIHGTWGGCAIIPEVDKFKVLREYVGVSEK